MKSHARRTSYSALCGAALTVALAAIVTTTDASPQEFVIIPEAIVGPDGTLTMGQAVHVRNGRIATVRDASEYADRDDVIRRPGAVLSPGLIDVMSQIGTRGSNVERVQPIDPDLAVYRMIDRADPAFQAALEAGITAVLVHPGANNLVGGTTALLRTGSPTGEAELLVAHGPLVVCLGSSTLSLDRPPSSRAGAMAMLRTALSEARVGRGSERLRELTRQTRAAIFRAETGADATAGLRLLDQYGVHHAVAHTVDLHEIAEALAADDLIIVGPLGLETPTHVLRSPTLASDRGATIAIAGGTPDGDAGALRRTAALTVRYGLDPAAARRAMTIVAAGIAGVPDTLGAIESGRDADLVLFSADPLRPEARVLEVYLRGERVIGIKAGEEKPWAMEESEDDTTTTTTGSLEGGGDEASR